MVLPLDTKVDRFRFNKSFKTERDAWVPASLPPACLNFCYRDNRKARVIPTAAHQSTPSENDKMYRLCSGLHWTEHVFTLRVIWTAVLLCNCVSCQWPDCFPEWPHSDEWMTVCFMIPFVLTLHVPSLSNCAFLFALVFLFLFFQAWSRMAMQVYGLKFKTLYCLPEGSGLGKQNNKFSWSLRLLGNFCSKWGQLGLK